MTKNQDFSRWANEHPLIRLVTGKRRPGVVGDSERELVLLLVPILALSLVFGSTAGYAFSPLVLQSGLGEEEIESSLSAETLENEVTESFVQEEEIDPVAEAITQWGEPDIAAILASEFPEAEWTLNGDYYSGLVWLGPGVKPSEDELRSLWPKVGRRLAQERELAAQERLEKEEQDRIDREKRASDPNRQALVDMIDYKSIFGQRPDYSKILSIHYAGAEWSLNGDSYAGLTWFGPGSKPSKAELDALWDGVARSLALALPLSELEARAGVSDTEEYVDGQTRPKGFTEDTFVASPANCRQLPQIPPTGGGSPVGSIEIFKDPTGSQNFEQLYGVDLTELACRIADAHGYFGGKYSLGLGLNGDRTLMWYSDQVNEGIVRGVLEGIGAFRTE